MAHAMYMLQLCVTQLQSLNSGPIIRTNSEARSWVPHLYDPVSFHFRSLDPTLMLQLHVTQLQTPNSGPILRTNPNPTPRLVPKSPIGMTLYNSISDPRIPPLLPDMSSLSYILFEHCFTLPYLLFPALPSAMPVCSVLIISEFPASPSKPIRLSLYIYKTF